MSTNPLWQPPPKKTLYDWKVPWHTLEPVSSDNPRHEVILFSVEILLEMLQRGHLTGAAKEDAENSK